jgi:hypothetical protein
MILAESGNATFNSCHSGNIRWMPPEALRAGDEDEAKDEKPTKAWDVYSYGCVMMQVCCVFSFKCHVADTMQVFSGHHPYAHIKNILAVMGAIQRGREPFSHLAGIDEEIQQFAQLCWSRNREYRPLVVKIVEFLWSRENIAEIMKTMLSQLPRVSQISQAVLTKCDYHPHGLDVLGTALKCKWVVHGSSEIEVSVFS